MKKALCIALIFWRCSGSEGPSTAPCDKIKIAQVLYDIRLLEGMYSADQALVDSAGGISAQYHFILEKYQISKEEFIACYESISKNPSEIKLIEDSVRASLERQSANAYR
ncbi:MAG: DUF4296 domain-containing protein [Flavobacteriales bacterium]